MPVNENINATVLVLFAGHLFLKMTDPKKEAAGTERSEIRLKGYLETIGFHGEVDILIQKETGIKMERMNHMFHDVAPSHFEVSSRIDTSLEYLDPEVWQPFWNYLLCFIELTN